MFFALFRIGATGFIVGIQNHFLGFTRTGRYKHFTAIGKTKMRVVLGCRNKPPYPRYISPAFWLSTLSKKV